MRRRCAGTARQPTRVIGFSAQYSIGWLYERGRGIAQDYVEAMWWYRKAADPGNTFRADQNGEAKRSVIFQVSILLAILPKSRLCADFDSAPGHWQNRCHEPESANMDGWSRKQYAEAETKLDEVVSILDELYHGENTTFENRAHSLAAQRSRAGRTGAAFPHGKPAIRELHDARERNRRDAAGRASPVVIPPDDSGERQARLMHPPPPHHHAPAPGPRRKASKPARPANTAVIVNI